MVSGYIVQSGTAVAKDLVNGNYVFTLNGISTSTIVMDGVNEEYYAEFDIDDIVDIYKGGTLKFRGPIIDIKDLSGGGMILTCFGQEHDLTEEKTPMVGSATVRVWNNTSDETIINTLVTSISGWTLDHTNSASVTLPSFRSSASESVWNAMIRNIKMTGKDILIDQENKVVYLYDELTRNTQFSFIEGRNARNISRKRSKSKAGKVIVYGKGDGVNQIIGSFGSGTPVVTKTDRNVISNDAADDVAEAEYDRLNPQLKNYSFEPLESIDSLRIGDAGNITNPSARINEEVDIVRIGISFDSNNNEKLNLQVSNPALRLATKNALQERLSKDAEFNQGNTSMQGSGNLSQWSSAKNGNDSLPLKINFTIDDTHFQDEAGNIRVQNMTLDYDVDKYNQQYGSVGENNKAPVIEDDSDINGVKSIVADDDDNDSAQSFGNSFLESLTFNNISQDGDMIVFMVDMWVYDHDVETDYFDYYVRIYNNDTATYYPDSTGVRITRGEIRRDYLGSTDNVVHNHVPGAGDNFCTVDTASGCDGDTYDYCVNATAVADLTYDFDLGIFYIPQGNVTILCPGNPNGDDYEVQVKCVCGAGDFALANIYAKYQVISEHKHGPGGYNAVLHKHDVSIGDGIGEAGTENATEVDIYLDFYNTGTSTWDNKHSILNTGKTLDIGVDLTDSGTYPDATGSWRVRVYTDSSDADFLQGIVRVFHEIDNR